MKLQDVMISPPEAVTLSDRRADEGLFFVFDESDNFIGIVLYNMDTDSYYIQTATNLLNSLVDETHRETLEDFYDRLQKEYRHSYLKYIKTTK
ncbi:hypothetical protein [Intestinibacter sp.]|uniref:hypothetical protein n=1 Tax=Intestinibacter sp. TaxID=1965304 RepID=UPI003F144711